MTISFPSYVKDVIEQLNRAGFEAYAVGGCVRDSLLGKTPHDWDLATSAEPEQVKQVFLGHTVLETGIQHGTVTLLVDQMPLEITTYRLDGGYSDGRHPDQVAFTRSLEEDLARRDFTVNAMACHPREGIVDRFGGREDLARGMIRCVGDPDRRFGEDALRMLRALRFSAVLGFPIEEGTAQSLLRNCAGLCHVAAERIFSELRRMLCGKDILRVLMDFPQVLWVFLPELQPLYGFDQQTPYHLYDVWEHTARAVSLVQPQEVLRLTMLLHDVGKPRCFQVDEVGQGHFKGHPAASAEIAGAMLSRLKADNETRRRVLTLIQYHDTGIPAERPAVKRWLGKLGADGFDRLLKVKVADDQAKNPRFARLAHYQRLAEMAAELRAEEACCALPQLAVDGRDLMAAGYPAGPALGRRLQRLLKLVLDEKCPNEKEALLAAARALPEE